MVSSQPLVCPGDGHSRSVAGGEHPFDLFLHAQRFGGRGQKMRFSTKAFVKLIKLAAE